MAEETDIGSVDEDALATASEDKPKANQSKADPPGKRGSPHILLRIVLGVSGLLLLVGFFLPWIKLSGGEIESVSGLGLVMADQEAIRALIGQDSQRFVLLLIPGFGVALTAVGFLGMRYSGQIAAVLGILIVGYGMVTMVIMFFEKTGYGMWLILLGAFLAVAAGTVTFIRSRHAPEAASKS